MSYMLRDRPDGQFEIVLTREIMIGIFPERATASRVMFFLQEDEIELIEEQPASFGQAAKDAAAAVDEVLQTDRIVAPTPPKLQLPAALNRPRAPARQEIKVSLTEKQTEAAFARIAGGEKIGLVAPDFGLTFHQLRGMWANHARKMQQHLAGGGKIACKICGKPFVQSLTNWDACARCSHD